MVTTKCRIAHGGHGGHGGGGHGGGHGGDHGGGHGGHGGGDDGSYNRRWPRSYYSGNYSTNFYSPNYMYPILDWPVCNAGNYSSVVSFSNNECDWPVDPYSNQLLYQKLNTQLNCCNGFMPQPTSECVQGNRQYTCSNENYIIY